MDKIVKNKRNLELVISCRLQKKITKFSLLFMYYLTKFDGVIKSSFWVIPKITPASLYKPIHNIINYSTSICPFESGKRGKEEEKLNKLKSNHD